MTGETLRLRVELGYDGAPFKGWARQPGLPSVQGALEDALEKDLEDAGAGITRAVQLDAHLPAAAAWIVVAAEEIYAKEEDTRPEREVIRGWTEWQAKGTFSKERWAAWKAAFEKVAISSSEIGSPSAMYRTARATIA